MTQFVSVDSAIKTATAGVLDLTITADLGDGAGNQSLPYAWTSGDETGFGPEIDAYMTAHPDLAIADYVPPAVTGAGVDVERERRRCLPLSVTVPSGTFTVNMDAISQANIQGLATVGMYLTGAGSSQTTTFRDYDNSSHDLTPADLVALGLSVAAHIQALYVASWAIKALSPIPADFAADSHWS